MTKGKQLVCPLSKLTRSSGRPPKLLCLLAAALLPDARLLSLRSCQARVAARGGAMWRRRNRQGLAPAAGPADSGRRRLRSPAPPRPPLPPPLTRTDGSVLDSMSMPREEPRALTVMLMVRRGDMGEASAAAEGPRQEPLPRPPAVGLQSSVVMAMRSCVCGMDSCTRVVVVACMGLQGGVMATAAAHGEVGWAIVAAPGSVLAAMDALARRWCASSSCWVAVLKAAGKQQWVSSWAGARDGV
jgi:hypothetical protein